MTSFALLGGVVVLVLVLLLALVLVASAVRGVGTGGISSFLPVT